MLYYNDKKVDICLVDEILTIANLQKELLGKFYGKVVFWLLILLFNLIKLICILF
jgi:hypothetical protein